MITTIPNIDFNEETVEYKNLFQRAEDTEVIHGEVKGGTQIICYLNENQSEFSKTSTEGFGEETLGVSIIQQLRSSDSECPEDRDDPTGQRS